MRISDHVEAVAEQGRAAPYRRRVGGAGRGRADLPGLDDAPPARPRGHAAPLGSDVGAEGHGGPAGGAHPRTAEEPRDGLEEWFAEGHFALVATLTEAAPDLECWTFLLAPSPLAFWSAGRHTRRPLPRVPGGWSPAATPRGRCRPPSRGRTGPAPGQLALLSIGSVPSWQTQQFLMGRLLPVAAGRLHPAQLSGAHGPRRRSSLLVHPLTVREIFHGYRSDAT